MSELWVEKHRPQSVAQIRGQAAVVQRLGTYAGQKNFPHLLFAGPPGTGKTTAAMALIKNQEYFQRVAVKYTQREINGKLKSLFDLVMLYAETNSQINEQWKEQNVPRTGWYAEFEELTTRKLKRKMRARSMRFSLNKTVRAITTAR